MRMNLVFPVCFTLSLLLAVRTQSQDCRHLAPPIIETDWNDSTNEINIILTPMEDGSTCDVTYKIAYREYNGSGPCPQYDSTENYNYPNISGNSHTLPVDPNKGICLTAAMFVNGTRVSKYSDVILIPDAPSSGFEWDIRLKALVGGGGAVVLLLALITCGAMICLCCKTHKRGTSKRHQITTIEARNQLSENRGENGDSAVERPILQGGNLTVSFEWHMQDALKFMESVPDEPIAMEDIDEDAAEEEEKEDEPSHTPPLPDRAYLQDMSFVEKLKPESKVNAVQAVPLSNSGAINVKVDWNVQSRPPQGSVSQTQSSRSQESIGNSNHPETSNPLLVGRGLPVFTAHSQVQSSLPDIQSEAMPVQDTRYVPTRHGLYNQVDPSSLACKQFGSNIEIPVSTFTNQTTTYQSSCGVLQLNLPPPTPFTEIPPRVPPKRIKRARPPKMEETAVQDDLQALVPSHHMIPAVNADQKESQDPNNNRESSPDPDLPPTWIDRSVTMTETYFPFRHDSTSGMTWPSAGKQLQSQKESTKVGSGDGQEASC